MKFRLTFTGNFLRVVYPLPALESYIIKSTSRTSISTQKPSLSLAFSVVKSLVTDMLTFERQDLQYDVSYSGASKGRRQAVCGDRRMTFRPWCFRESTICMASYNGCNGFTWHSFLPLPMIQPAKQLTFKHRRKRKNMLPFLFQNVEKASYSVFIFFADYLWHEGTQLIMSSLFVAETGLQFR